MTEHDDALADGVRAALAERAGGATVSPDAWSRIEAARGAAGPGEARSARVTPFRRPTTLLAAAAAVAVLLVLATLTHAEDATQDVGTEGGPDRGETLRSEDPVADGTTSVPDSSLPTIPGPTGTAPAAGEPTAPGTGGGGVRTLDLASATYPSTVCPSIRPLGAEFTLRSGRAESGEMGVTLQESAFGDISGDSREEAVARFQCGYQQTDVIERVVAVLGESGGRPVVLATVASSGTDRTGWTVIQPVPATGEVPLGTQPLDEYIDGVAVAGGRLQVLFRQGFMQAEAYGQGYQLTATYRYDGSALVREATTARTTVEYEGQVGREALAWYAIRKSSLATLFVPVGGAAGSGTSVCGELFGPSSQGLNLSAGRVTVPVASGPAGSVELGPVIYESVSSTDAEDAVVVLRCEHDGRRAAVPVLVRRTGGVPKVVQVLVPPQADLLAASVVIDGYDHLRVNWERADGGSPSLPSTRYRRDGARLVPG